jgi:hypothetical protein
MRWNLAVETAKASAEVNMQVKMLTVESEIVRSWKFEMQC